MNLHVQISILIFYIYLSLICNFYTYYKGYLPWSFPLCLRMFLQGKKVGTLHMLPDIVQTQSNNSSSKNPDDQDG